MKQISKHLYLVLYFFWFAFRFVTSPFRRLPDFLIIGAQKSGTTFLYSLLSRHPDIIPAKVKEVHFFDKNFHKGLLWYKTFFPFSFNKKKITGEATPYYLFHPLTPVRASKSLKSVKLIVILRNPVFRAYSHYQMNKYEGTENIFSFEEAIKEEEGRINGEIRKIIFNEKYFSYNHLHFTYLSRGKYYYQIQEWFKYFPSDKFLFIKSETFFANPNIELKKVYNFLGIKEIENDCLSPINEGSYTPMKNKTKEALKYFFEESNQKLKALLGINFSEEDVKNKENNS